MKKIIIHLAMTYTDGRIAAVLPASMEIAIVETSVNFAGNMDDLSVRIGLVISNPGLTANIGSF